MNLNEIKNLSSQNAQVLNWLKGNSLTPKQAVKLFSIYRLSARIYDLRKEGHQIGSKREKHISGAGNIGYHFKYFLIK